MITHVAGLLNHECRQFFEAHLNRPHEEVVKVVAGAKITLFNTSTIVLVASIAAAIFSGAGFLSFITYGVFVGAALFTRNVVEKSFNLMAEGDRPQLVPDRMFNWVLGVIDRTFNRRYCGDMLFAPVLKIRDYVLFYGLPDALEVEDPDMRGWIDDPDMRRWIDDPDVRGWIDGAIGPHFAHFLGRA